MSVERIQSKIYKSFISFAVLSILINSPFVAADEKGKKPLISKHGVVAYTWNSDPTGAKAILSTSSYTFNYGRSVTRTRPSKGMYEVKFDGLRCNRGQFTVNAYGGTEYKSCRIGSWRGKTDCVVSVYCFDKKGEHLDSKFNLLFVD